jgi:hypothetical protein
VTGCLVFVATLVWRFLTFTGFTNDHYASLALAQQVLLGERPVRDFSDPGWPLTYLLSAGAWLLAGDRMITEWTLTAVGLAIGAACTLLAARRLSMSLSTAGVVTILELLIFPRTYAYPKILAYAAGALALLAVAANPAFTRIVVMAAVTALAFLLRHDHGLFIGLASAVCVALASRADGWRIACRRVATLTAAVVAFLLPWIVFVSLNGGLVSYFETAIEFARAEANASNLKTWPGLKLVPGKPLLGLDPPSRPLAQVEWSADTTEAVRQTLEQQYGLEFVRESGGARFYDIRNTEPERLRILEDDPHVAGTIGLGLRRPAWRDLLSYVSPWRVAPALHDPANADAWLFWLFWALPTVCGAMVCHRLFRAQERWPGELATIGALVVVAILVNAGFLRDLLRTRFSDAIVPAALLGAWAMGLAWRDRWRRRSAQALVQVAAVGVLGVSVIAISQVAEVPERIERTGVGEGLEGVYTRARWVSDLLHRPHRQSVSPPSRVSGGLIPFFEYLDRCTSRSDRLIVTGEFPDVLVLAGRGFAGDGVVFGAWYSSATHQDRTIERLQAGSGLFALEIDYSAFRNRFGLVDAYLTQDYQPMVNIPVEGAGTIAVHVRRNRHAVRTDPASGWPCFR